MVSHTDQELAEELKLPLSFFLYKSKDKCKGCVGCEEDSETVSLNIILNFPMIIYFINLF